MIFQRLKEALSEPRLRLYLTGSFLSNVGTWIQRIVVGWLAFRLTGAATWVGMIAAAEVVTILLVSPFVGSLIDRTSPVRILLVGQILASGQALVLAALAFFDVLSIEALLACSLSLGLIEGINQPSRLSILPEVAEKKNLRLAVSMISLGFNLGRFVGPSVGGIIVTFGDSSTAFLANALSFVPLTVLLVRLIMMGRSKRLPDEEREIAGVLTSIKYISSSPMFGPIFLMLIASNFFLRSMIELVPAIAGLWYSPAPQDVARLTTCIGFGAMLGGFFMILRGSSRSAVSSTLIMPVAMVAVVILFAFFGDTRLPGYALLVLIGFTSIAGSIGMQSIIQISVRSGFRGRVLSIYGIVQRVVPAVGAIGLGALFDIFGVRGPMVAFALVALGVWLVTWRSRKVILDQSGPD